MRKVICPRNHYYDFEKFDSCPVCKKEKENNSAKVNYENDSHTFFANVTEEPRTEQIYDSENKDTDDETALYMTGEPEEADEEATTYNDISGIEDSTMYLDMEEEMIYGWLVCVAGASYGKEYTVNKKNCELVINNDGKIYTEKVNFADCKLTLKYNKFTRRFTLHNDSNYGVTLNGEMLIRDSIITMYDRISYGDTILMFMPLCGNAFSWNNK